VQRRNPISMPTILLFLDDNESQGLQPSVINATASTVRIKWPSVDFASDMNANLTIEGFPP